jgi:hypothetical protein
MEIIVVSGTFRAIAREQRVGVSVVQRLVAAN